MDLDPSERVRYLSGKSMIIVVSSQVVFLWLIAMKLQFSVLLNNELEKKMDWSHRAFRTYLLKRRLDKNYIWRICTAEFPNQIMTRFDAER